ncbi:uncharacterized protein LOC118749943, partial [Rhagoletis pomonella]|uniref:uncharacterized protein LOC118749943 n=1 Tax=Rhagoletis pomonella TaxID=28610 RepID=UPI0017822811
HNSLQGSGVTPALPSENIFFTPPAISSRSEENKLNKTPLIQSTSGVLYVHRTEGLLLPRTLTLPSIREEEFRRTLLRRDTHLSSTPLHPIGGLTTNDLNYGITDLAPGIPCREARTLQLEIPGGINSTIEVSEVLGTIVATAEEHLNTSHMEMPAEVLQDPGTLQPAETLEPTPSNERRNWFDVLRQRQVDLRYVKVVPNRRRKRHHTRRPQTGNRTYKNARNEINEEIGLLQALPPMPAPLAEDVFEHIESISTIMDNLVEWQRMLKLCYQGAGNTSTAAFLSASYYAYDVETPIDADVQRLQIKLDILQEIIRNVSFDITKTPLQRNKRFAAVALSFLIELQSAEIIQINDNGHCVKLI